MYKKVDVEHTMGDDEPTDDHGFLGVGNFYRPKKIMRPISESSFLACFTKNNKLKEIMLQIHEIDKDRNGYVTRNELDDILKLNYEKELGDKNLLPFITKFSSISNKILIDYKGFKEWVRMAILEHDA